MHSEWQGKAAWKITHQALKASRPMNITTIAGYQMAVRTHIVEEKTAGKILFLHKQKHFALEGEGQTYIYYIYIYIVGKYYSDG